MHPFPKDTKVQTNEQYFKDFKRKVLGVAVVNNQEPPKELTLVRWLYQEGEAIEAHKDQLVLMMSKDLEKVVENYN